MRCSEFTTSLSRVVRMKICNYVLRTVAISVKALQIISFCFLNELFFQEDKTKITSLPNFKKDKCLSYHSFSYHSQDLWQDG